MSIERTDDYRQGYLDCLRVLASFAVMVIHVCSQNIYHTNVNTGSWIVFSVYDGFFRWGVPIFLMISGSIFLNREPIPTKVMYKRYVSRMFCSFWFWGVVYYLLGGNSVFEQLSNLVKPDSLICYATILRGHYHLWFLPMMAGIYMCIPFIRAICDNSKLMYYFLTLSFIVWSVIPTVEVMFSEYGSTFALGIADSIFDILAICDVGSVSGYSFYFILGYYLSNKTFSKSSRRVIYLLGIIGFILSTLFTYLISINAQNTHDVLYDDNCVAVVLQSVAIYVFIKQNYSRFSGNSGFIARLAKYSFGAYLVHILFMDRIDRHMGFNSLSINPIISVPILASILFVCSYCFSFILNKVPFINKHFV